MPVDIGEQMKMHIESKKPKEPVYEWQYAVVLYSNNARLEYLTDYEALQKYGNNSSKKNPLKV